MPMRRRGRRTGSRQKLSTRPNSRPDARHRHGPSPVTLKTEILLDRPAISPGQIDGKDGDNLRKAISAFQGPHGLKRTGRLDEKTWSGLTQTSNDAVITKYDITEDDTKGPFVKDIPHDLVKMAQLHRLSYAPASAGPLGPQRRSGLGTSFSPRARG